MYKFVFFFLLAITVGFADQVVLDNQTTYPSKGTRMAIQWAYSVKEVERSNHVLMYGGKLSDMKSIKQIGKVSMNVPKKAQYFRILVWSSGGEVEPDFHTNWVAVINEKVYALKPEYLVPSELLAGSGC